MTRVLVCGGRDFADRDLMARTLAEFKPASVHDASEHIIIQGGARGADRLAREWAEVFGVRFREYPADWAKHGKAAGPIRNRKMIAESKPDLVVAFPGDRGTADCVRQAQAAGIEVRRVGPTSPE